ncbi:hypothetical protein PFX98_17845 [Paucibacter sediminis]|uniref:Helix-turn-helix domain-containing protein n=1 Tax=Paucibacter sediminis TaxID=3019553 RepID=A0AA95SK72_9BURK|nr:hypothetical protein [Paucibacter sp. S2-9]WIT10763.1 hypothetical protein PFX98_17845 [Paucibacter sp. S2-9]
MGRSESFQMDEMGAHARLYEKIAHSPAWLALSFSARALYMQLRVKLKQTNNGNIDATLSTLRHAGFKSSSTVAKVLRELEVVGLIAKTRQGGIAAGGRLCNLYRFTDKPVFEHPKQDVRASKATHEWRAWTGLREAEAAIRTAHASAKLPEAEKNRRKGQRSNRISSKTEALPADLSSKSGPSERPTLRKVKLASVA